MARPRTPTKTLKLNGGFRSDRHNDRRSEPKPAGELRNDPPNELTNRYARATYKRLRPILEPVATDWDQEVFETLCRWYGEYLVAYDLLQSASDVNDRYKISYTAANAWKQCWPIMAKFGLTPSDRASLQTKKVDDASDPALKYLA